MKSGRRNKIQLNQTPPEGYALFFKGNAPQPYELNPGVYMNYWYDLNLAATMMQRVDHLGNDIGEPYQFALVTMQTEDVNKYAPDYLEREYILVKIRKDPNDPNQQSGFIAVDENQNPIDRVIKAANLSKVKDLNDRGQIALPSRTVKTINDGLRNETPGQGETGSLIDWGIDDPFHTGNMKTKLKVEGFLKWVYLAGFIYSSIELTKKDTNKIIWGSAATFTGYKSYKYWVK